MNHNNNIPNIPGRGLVTAMSTNMRLEYLNSLSIQTDALRNTTLDLHQIQHNIESFIGSVEIPVGIVGPLLYLHDGTEELVYTAAGTLEGALIASMNRGAKAVSQGGGFRASIRWQKMSRAPMFLFEDTRHTSLFQSFIESHFQSIKCIAEKYSNHATLLSLDCTTTGNAVHVKFTYSTGDASGQNMTTTCTWHAMLYIVHAFTESTGIQLQDFILEGNGSADKKISQSNITHGRGVNVTAECFLPEKVIHDVLRTSSQKMLHVLAPSQSQAALDGMLGYCINVANAIAALYVATGQDLGCIHESSVGFLGLREADGGLHVTLNLPNLVVGTVGGGTHLAKQSEALRLMKCHGSGHVSRFAALIAGFALSLELSTYAAIVSGEFAKAHEKLGRNKPMNWLLLSELDDRFLRRCITHCPHEILAVHSATNTLLENGILTHIAARSSKKVIGFESFTLQCRTHQGKEITLPILMKSKALDTDVIKGLHALAASIDPELSDLIKRRHRHLEYMNCHRKELAMYAFLSRNTAGTIPHYYGEYTDESREIYLLVIEYLHAPTMLMMNSENSPELWTPELIRQAITAINDVHTVSISKGVLDTSLECVHQLFEPWKANDLYNKLIHLLIAEEEDEQRRRTLSSLIDAALLLETMQNTLTVAKTIIHNDFNPRNVGVRLDGSLVIYDWELALLNYPHRDIVEFLSFVLPENFSEPDFLGYLDYHYRLEREAHYTEFEWRAPYRYAIIEFILTRVAFYEVAGIVVKYDFSRRVLDTAFAMLRSLDSYV